MIVVVGSKCVGQSLFLLPAGSFNSNFILCTLNHGQCVIDSQFKSELAIYMQCINYEHGILLRPENPPLDSDRSVDPSAISALSTNTY
eukprot:COSAG02_NODE_758_length_17516_cov_53.301085_12_plen_88_part_00